MDTFLQDLRFACRTLLKRPVPTTVAVLTLALGIGANTAIFSVVDAVLLSPLPFREPERLAVIWASNPDLAAKVGLPDNLPASPGTFQDWKRDARSFESMAMVGADRLALTGKGEPELLGAVQVSGDFFTVLGSRPLLGRTLLPEDDLLGKRTTVLLSQGLWQRRFGGDPEIVGRKVLLDGEPLTVVGVMPAAFNFPRGAQFPFGYGFTEAPDVWVPMGFSAEDRENRDNHSHLTIARLKPGVGLAAAREEMNAITRRLQATYPNDVGWGARPESLAGQLVGPVRPALLVLLGAVGLVLLIACANVANLFLAQAVTRQKEISIRTAMGAGRGRLARQLLTESLLLAVVGGALGLLAAFWGLRWIASWIPASMPVPAEISLDARVLLFTLAAVLLAGLLSGLVPALQTTRTDLSETLREGNRGAGSAAPSRRMRSALVIAEVALAVLLVIGAGLLIRSFARLTAVDPGFRADNVLTLQVILPGSKYNRDQRAPFFASVLERLRALPGVEAAGAVSNLPLSGEESVGAIVIEGRPRPEPNEIALADQRSIMPGYFEALGIALVRGRTLEERDLTYGEDGPRMAVIDETMAKAYWPGEDPLGRRFRLGFYDDTDANWFTVVGVVRNVRHSGLHVDPRPQMYLPESRFPSGQMTLVLRTAGNPEALTDEARAAVYAVDRDQPVSRVGTMERMVGESLAGRRFTMILLVVFAGLALALAAVGIYGITSYSVTQRTREMGLRMALGARPGQVVRLVVQEAGTLAVLGIVLGLGLGFAATRVMSSLLFGVKATDPGTYVAVSVA
ncbi:MAG TPA: ABC transporter permease, partial [Thermoanaerobaculia bacterium]|nr:ABC transporter permease [Thermoanaerobaculia bacterium]